MLRSKVLIISGDGLRSKFMMDCLENAGYQSEEADTGFSAVKLIQKDRPDLVILDWRLPDMNGINAIKQIRSIDQTKKPLIMLIGSEMNEDDRMNGLEAGADLCLAEPLHAGVLVARVYSLLRRVASRPTL